MSRLLEVHGGVRLSGSVVVPGDKSISHRALMIGALSEGTTVIRGRSDGDDVARTEAAVVAMGAEVDGERITGGRHRLSPPGVALDLGNSGTSMNLLAGLCATLPWRTTLDGDASLRNRPVDRLVEALGAMGASLSARGGRLPPLVIDGGHLRGVDYRPPSARAQLKSAVLLAGTAADGETVVREPVPTRAHTEEILALAGADVVTEPGVVRVRPSTLRSFEIDVPGDPSQAAFWVVGACVVPGSDLVVEGVYVGQGRRGFLDVLLRMGAAIEIDHVAPTTARIRARYAPLHGTTVTAEEEPGLRDEIPVLAVAAAVAEGQTVFEGAAELRVKETDRIATITSELGAVGARVEALPEGLVVSGGARLRGGAVRSHGDHRIAMAMAIAGLIADEPTRIEGWDAVATSYPGFERALLQCTS